jgi:cytochrome c peroxidase
MKYVTKPAIALVVSGVLSTIALAEGLRERVLRDAALDAGLVPANQLSIEQPKDLVEVGKLLFESRLLSLNNDTACASCHLDRFGSTDGLPNAIGTEGEGFGEARILNGGDIVPRNVLPFWGRGGIGFDVLFWDGKVDGASGRLISQFGADSPSSDPLVVAVHLPPAEIGEMVIDRRDTEDLQTEDVETANGLYAELAERIRSDPILGEKLASARNHALEDLAFIDVAEAIASFIRFNFRVKDTKLHQFVFDNAALTDQETEGGLHFYGRAGCSQCHNGPYFTDFDFHAIPFPQVGFGRNGFGVDYGRFNVTLDEANRYGFRTPPLYNVTKTGPYSHSGSIAELNDAIRIHIDPLLFVEPKTMDANDRIEYYERLRIWSGSPLNGVVVTDIEIDAIASFLGTLSYDSDLSVEFVD